MVSCVHRGFSADIVVWQFGPAYLCIVLLRFLHHSCSSFNCSVPIYVFIYFELLSFVQLFILLKFFVLYCIFSPYHV